LTAGSAHCGLLWSSTVGYPSDSLASCTDHVRLLHVFKKLKLKVDEKVGDFESMLRR